MSNGSPSWSESYFTTVELPTRSVSVFSCLVDDLIKSWENIIAELNLSYSSVSWDSYTDCKTCDSLLRKRSIKNSLNTIFLLETTCASENATKFYIFAEYFGSE